MWEEIIYTFLNFNGSVVEVWEWKSSFTPHFTEHVITYPSITWYDNVIKWKLFPRNWPFVRGIHRSPVNSRHKGQLRGALMFSLICARINDWVNNRETGDLRRHRGHYDIMLINFVYGNSDVQPRPECCSTTWVLGTHFSNEFTHTSKNSCCSYLNDQ